MRWLLFFTPGVSASVKGARFATMVFKLAVASIALATAVGAAHIKRVTCPDGNVTSNAAVRNLVLKFHLH